MTLHRSYLLLTVGGFILLAGFYWHSRTVTADYHERRLPAQQELVKELGLTDLAIWTEARYTRHLTQADLFTAFQDLPSAPEHFPAGSIMLPRFIPSGTAIKFRRAAERRAP